MNQPKKIAVLGLSYPFRGGIAHYSTLLVRELRKQYRVTFITLKRQYPSFLFPGTTQYDHSTSRIVEDNDSIIDSINPFTWISTAFLLKREAFDLIIVQWWNPFFGLAFGTIINVLAFMAKTKICFLCHNVLPHESTIVDRILSKYAYKNVQYFIVHSEEDQKNLLSLKPKAVVKKNLHPTYAIFSDFDIYEKHQARQKLNISHKNILLFFGLIRKYKGLKDLIYAMEKVVQHLDCVLLIVGEFYEPKSEYESLINELSLNDYVIIVDKYINNEEVSLYFCSADVVVLPYIEATQSGIVQIAFGLNTPVITTNVGGLPEAVSNGKTGFIVEKESPEKLAEAIVKFYQGNYGDRFREEIQKMTRDFSWDVELRNIASFLRENQQ